MRGVGGARSCLIGLVWRVWCLGWPDWVDKRLGFRGGWGLVERGTWWACLCLGHLEGEIVDWIEELSVRVFKSRGVG